MILECGEIHGRLKAFLGDLLLEEEYRAFLRHLEDCSRCGLYVRSISDLSNHLWKLGNVPVPPDFSATVLFKMKREYVPAVQAEAGRVPGFPETRKLLSGKYILGGTAIFFLVLAPFIFFLKPFFLEDRPEKPRKQKTAAPAPAEEAIDDKEPAEEEEAEIDFARLLALLSKSALPPPPSGTAPGVPPAAVSSAPASSAGASPAGAPYAAASETEYAAPQHWHFTYFRGEDHDSEAEKWRQGLRLLETLLGTVGELQAQIDRLEEENKPKLGQVYSENEPLPGPGEKSEQESLLETLRNQRLQIEGQIEQLQRENREAEKEWLKVSAEKKRRETQVKAKVLETLVDLNAKFQYQDENFIVFTAPLSAHQILGRILPVFKPAGRFQDFGEIRGGSVRRQKEIALYFGQSHHPGLHWHAGIVSRGQKEELYDAVRELGGSKDYEAEELAVLSVPKTSLDELAVRVAALRMKVQVFGETAGEDAPLSTAPVKISICYSMGE